MNQELIQPIRTVRFRPGLVDSPPGEETRAFITEKNWNCHVWQDTPGTYHSPHDHPYSHRVLCESGWIEFTVAEETYRLEPGDALDLPRRVTHEAKSNPQQPTRYWLLQPPE